MRNNKNFELTNRITNSTSTRCSVNIIVLHWNGINFEMDQLEENRNWECCLSATQNILMACNNRVDGLWGAREIEYRRLDRKFENGRFLKMKIKLDYRDIDIERIIFALDPSSHPRIQLEAVYAGKPHRPGWTDLWQEEIDSYSFGSIFQGSCYVNRRRDGVKRAAKSQVARGISASKQVARNEETSFREFEPMEK